LTESEKPNSTIGNESQRVEERSERRDTQHESQKSIPEFDPGMKGILGLISCGCIGARSTLRPGGTSQSRSRDSYDSSSDDDDALEDEQGGEDPAPIADAFQILHVTALSEEGYLRRNLTSCD